MLGFPIGQVKREELVSHRRRREFSQEPQESGVSLSESNLELSSDDELHGNHLVECDLRVLRKQRFDRFVHVALCHFVLNEFL